MKVIPTKFRLTYDEDSEVFTLQRKGLFHWIDVFSSYDEQELCWESFALAFESGFPCVIKGYELDGEGYWMDAL